MPDETQAYVAGENRLQSRFRQDGIVIIGKHENKQAKADKHSDRSDIATVGEQRLARVERLDDDMLEGVVGGYMPIITRPPANNIR